VMIGHYVVPALTGSRDTPIFASKQGIDFIRNEMGFDGVVITDALDMGALDQGPNQAIEVVAMMRAGVDLLMCMPDPDLQERVRTAVERGYGRDMIPDEALAESRRRIDAIRKGLQTPMPDPTAVGGSVDLAIELAEKSVTLVRNDVGLLPLHLDPAARILALQPAPSRVTPADTSNLYPPGLAQALRAHHDQITEIVYPQRPGTGDISRILIEAAGHQLVVAGTVNAGPEQAALVNGLLQIDVPVVTVAMRAPYDQISYPASATHLCTYTALEPSMVALARILFQGGSTGRLPVGIPGLHPLGHGLGT
jgi:beta-N-acetylhexosaminidase